jgi:hypothetical protein
MTNIGGADFNLWPHLIALAIAYALALPIGWNREKEERSAGLRTFPLVAEWCRPPRASQPTAPKRLRESSKA